MAAQVDGAGAREVGDSLKLVETPLETVAEVCMHVVCQPNDVYTRAYDLLVHKHDKLVGSTMSN